MGYIKYFLVSVVLGGLVFSYKGGTNISNTAGCSFSSYFHQRSVAVDSNNRVHVVWADEVDTASGSFYKGVNRFGLSNFINTSRKGKSSTIKLFYRRSVDGGVTFGDTVRLADSLNSSPTIATNGQDAVHIFYSKTDINDNYCIYYMRSVNGGSNWSDTLLSLSSDTIAIGGAAVAASGSNIVHSIWMKITNDSIYNFTYTHSTNSGGQWSAPQDIVTGLATTNIEAMSAGFNPCPAISASGNSVHLVWQSPADDTLGEIYYKRSTDNGDNWSSDTRFTTDNAFSIAPTVAASGNYVYVGWLQCGAQDSLFEYFVKISNNGGTSWGSPICLVSREDSLDVMGGTPHISANGNFAAVVYGVTEYDTLLGAGFSKIRIKYSNNNGAAWSSNVISGDTAYAFFPSLDIDNSGYAHIVWSGISISMENPDIYYSTVSLNAVEEGISSIKPEFSVYPSVTNQFTDIRYQLSARSKVSLKIYDIGGSVVRTVVNGEQCGGEHSVTFNTKGLAAGLYFVKLETGKYKESRKLVLMK